MTQTVIPCFISLHKLTYNIRTVWYCKEN